MGSGDGEHRRVLEAGYNLLESAEFEAMVVNAHRIKAVPGRKSDVKDAEWIAELLQHGLLRPSFIPDRPQRELRELVRYRRSVVQERAREVTRLQKVLEGANLKLGEDPAALVGLARGRLKSKSDQLRQALTGLVGAHQRFLIQEQLSHIEELEARLQRLDSEIARRLVPFEAALELLKTIPGVGRRVAEDLLAEIGG